MSYIRPKGRANMDMTLCCIQPATHRANEDCQKDPFGANAKIKELFEQIRKLSMSEDHRESPISNRCGPADEPCVGTDPSNSEYSGTGDIDEVAMAGEPTGLLGFRYVPTFWAGNSDGVRWCPKPPPPPPTMAGLS